VAAWQRFAFGVYGWGVPVLLAGTALLLLGAQRPRLTTRLTGILLAWDVALLIAHLRVPVGQELVAGARGEGWGVAAGIQAWAWRRLFGEVGLWWGLGLTALAAAFLLAGGSPLRTLESLSAGLLALLAWVVRATPRIFLAVVRGVRRIGQAAASRGRWLVSRPTERPEEPAPRPRKPRLDAVRSAPPMPEGPVVVAPAPKVQQPPLLTVEAPPAGRWTLPSKDLLDPPPDPKSRGRLDPQEVARTLEGTLRSFGVEARCVGWEQGPVVTRYELQPAPGVKVQRITSLANDIALALATPSVRIEAPIPGKSAVGIELPNERASLVTLRELLDAPEFERPDPLLVALGKDIAGYPVVANLAEMPHLLIAGATGSGKSVMLNALIATLLMRATPQQVRLVLVDPKRVELAHYEDTPHLLVPVVRTPKDAASKLRRIIAGMERRLSLIHI